MQSGLEKYGGTKKWLRLVYILMPVVAALDTVFPFLLRLLANRRFGKGPKYKLHLKSIHISWLRNTITIERMQMREEFTLTDTTAPLLLVKEIAIKFDSKLLWQGIFKCDVEAEHPVFSLMLAHIKKGGSKRFNIPVIIASMQFHNAELKFIDYSVQPNIEINVTHINLLGTVMANVPYGAGDLPSQIKLNGNVYDGTLALDIKTDFLKEDPTFDLNVEAKNIDLTKLNDFFRAYGNFNVKTGLLDVFSEIAAKQGGFNGYVKPLIQNLEIGKHSAEKGLLQRLWEGALNTATNALSNSEEDQLGTKLPVDGSFKQPNVHFIFAIIEVLSNAFIAALKPSLDNDIDISTVKKPEDNIQ